MPIGRQLRKSKFHVIIYSKNNKFFVYVFVLMIFIFHFHSLLFAGDIDRKGQPISVLDMPQGMRYNALSGDGYSNHFSHSIANISGVNPASITNFEKFSFGLEFQASGKIDPAWSQEVNKSIDQQMIYLP